MWDTLHPNPNWESRISEHWWCVNRLRAERTWSVKCEPVKFPLYIMGPFCFWVFVFNGKFGGPIRRHDWLSSHVIIAQSYTPRSCISQHAAERAARAYTHTDSATPLSLGMEKIKADSRSCGEVLKRGLCQLDLSPCLIYSSSNTIEGRSKFFYDRRGVIWIP